MSPEERTTDFSLLLHRIKPGKHFYYFKADDDFLEGYEAPLFDHPDLKIDLQLVRTKRVFDLNFYIHGSIELISDLTLNPFRHPIDFQHRMLLSQEQGHGAEEADEVIFIDPSTEEINLKQDIYDLVSLQIPFKKTPPNEEIPPEMKQYIVGSGPETDDTDFLHEAQSKDKPNDESEIDPRWEALKKLRNNED